MLELQSNLMEQCKACGFTLFGYNSKVLLEDMRFWLRVSKRIYINITIDMAPLDDKTPGQFLYYFAEIYDMDEYRPDIQEFKLLAAPIRSNNYYDALEKGIRTILPIAKQR